MAQMLGRYKLSRTLDEVSSWKRIARTRVVKIGKFKYFHEQLYTVRVFTSVRAQNFGILSRLPSGQSTDRLASALLHSRPSSPFGQDVYSSSIEFSPNIALI